jgi:outer membrane protein assembly factor BamB
LYAFDLNGEALWAHDFGVEMEIFGNFGEASSPVLFGNTIVVVFDHQGESFIEALDTRDGSTRWRRSRDEGTAWSSPYVVEHDGAVLVVTSGGKHITAYDIGTGQIEWRSPGLTPGPIPTPVAGGGLLFVASGSRERRVRAIDLSRTAGVGGAAIAWELARAAPYNPSPLLWGDELYLVRDGGMNAGTSRLSLIDARTGEARYLQERLPAAYTIKASPVGAGDKVYLLTEEGDVLVLRRGAPLEVLAINPMGEPFVASPAIAHGELFLRSRTHLFCIDGR